MGASGQNSPPQDGKYRKRTDKFQKTFSEPALHRAWEHYLNSSQSEGKDLCGIKSFGWNLRANIEHLSHAILTGAFSPSPAAKFYKPKKSGLLRTITIPRIEDALVFQAFAEEAARSEPGSGDRFANNVFSAILNPASRSEPGAVAEGDGSSYFFKSLLGDYSRFKKTEKQHRDSGAFTHYLRADIHCYYDSIPHALLLDKLRADFGFTRDMCAMLGKCLNAWSGTRQGPIPGVGIPQSVDSSHFFSNLYLRELDEWLIQQEGDYCRFQDDIVIFGKSRDAVEGLRTGIDIQLKALGLALNPQKTAIFSITEDGSEIPRDYYNIPDHYWCEYEEEVDFDVGWDDAEETLRRRRVELDAEGKQLVELATKRLQEIESEVVDFYGAGVSIESNSDALGFQQMQDHAFYFCDAAWVLRDYRQLPKLSEDAAMGWCRALETYPEHANILNKPLYYCRNSARVVEKLLQLIHGFQHLEYPRRHVIDILPPGIVSDQAVKEEFLQMLSNEDSWYVRRAIYALLLNYSRSGENTPDKEDTLLAVKAHAKTESDPVMIRELAFLFAGKEFDAEQREKNLEWIYS